tara:strand:- start:268967 stop:269794 length:828 start_codon:yes stop_codon:yes gene_type:complete
MNKLQLLIFLLFSAVFVCSAQSRYQRSKEFGITLGTQSYVGEFNKSPLNVSNIGYGFYYRYNFNRRVGLNFGFWSGTIEGADSTSEILFEKNRNLSFQNRIQELSVVFEMNYFDYQISNPKYPFSPYLFFGVSGIISNPKAENAQGEMVNLREIGTEGQHFEGGKPYNLINFAVPFGIGFRANIVKGLAVSVYAGARKTFTDYIDDVSSFYVSTESFDENERPFVDNSINPPNGLDNNEGTYRGDPSSNDWVFISGVMLNVKLNRKKNSCPAWNL